MTAVYQPKCAGGDPITAAGSLAMEVRESNTLTSPLAFAGLGERVERSGESVESGVVGLLGVVLPPRRRPGFHLVVPHLAQAVEIPGNRCLSLAGSALLKGPGIKCPDDVSKHCVIGETRCPAVRGEFGRRPVIGIQFEAQSLVDGSHAASFALAASAASARRLAERRP